jgi:tetratricopeptide (TPR) repeat protein
MERALALVSQAIRVLSGEKGRMIHRIFRLQCWLVCFSLAAGILLHCLSFVFAQTNLPAGQEAPGTLRNRVQQLLEAGKISEADDKVRQEVTAHGETPETLFLEGLVLFKQKRYTESMQRVERSLAQRQDDPEVYKLLAFNAVLLNRLDVVETALKSALELAPDDPAAHFHRGLLYFTTNRFALAKTEFERVTQLNPKYMKAYDMLALAEEELDEDDAIVRTYQQAIELAEQQNLKDESPYLHLAKFLWLRNRFEESLPAARKAAAVNPKSSEACYVLGRLLDKLGRDAEAKQVLDQSIRIDPDYSESYYLLSRIYFRQGRQEEAAKALERFEEGKKRGSQPQPPGTALRFY